MLSDKQCDKSTFSEFEDRCEGKGLWYNPFLLSEAKQMTWCDSHKHPSDVLVARLPDNTLEPETK